MIKVLALESSHLTGVKAHPKQSQYQDLIETGQLTSNLLSGWTVFDRGVAVAFGGLVETGDGMAGWLLFTDIMRPRHLLPIYRICKTIIDGLKEDGETVVFDMDLGDPAVRRWASLLRAVPLRTWQMNGRTMTRMKAA